MKIYQINVVCGQGSTGHIVLELADLIERQGGNCRVAYGRGNVPIGINSFKMSNNFDILWHVLMTRLTDRHGLFSKKATRRLLADIQKYNPDIIHLHNIHGYYLNYKILFKFLKSYGKPVVWTLHDCWAFTGHCSYFDFVRCDKWKTGCKECKLTGKYPKSLFWDASKQNYYHKKTSFTQIKNFYIVTPSLWLANKVQESFLNYYPVKVIYNGIDTKLFFPKENSEFRRKYGIENKKIILGVANVWSERKGLRDFIELQKILSDDYLIVLVGIGEKQKKMLPEERVLSISRTDSIEELIDIYSAADVYFNASVEETMGMTTVEALACGLPVVVYNRTAVPEIVEPNAGIVLEPGNIKEVKKAIEQLIAKPKIDYHKFALKYEKNKQYSKYLELYRKMLHGDLTSIIDPPNITKNQ